MWNLKRNNINELAYKKINRLTNLKNKLMVASGKGGEN